MSQKELEGWVKVVFLGFGPAVMVALAHDKNWCGNALQGVGVAIAAVCFIAAFVWVIMSDGKP